MEAGPQNVVLQYPTPPEYIAQPTSGPSPNPQPYPGQSYPPQGQPYPPQAYPGQQLSYQPGYQHLQGYSQPSPNPGVSPYPPAYYPGPYPGQGQQQQQQSIVITQTGPPVITQPRVYQSYCGHITLACFVFWLCGWMFGLIAFILAMLASSSSTAGDSTSARRLGRASIGVSIAGIVVGCIIISVAVGVGVTSYNNYNYNSDTCYKSTCGDYYIDRFGISICQYYTTTSYTCY